MELVRHYIALKRKLFQSGTELLPQLAELKMNYEADKSQFMREFHMQKEFLLSEHERDLENLKELHRTEVLSLEARMKEKQDKAEKVSARII